ncbi:GMC family oxidoreductase [Pseudonocardia spinosispora]|uniref:GMC family oxidoreductase n=1 Tax=Pseudonocardia spinosispora TaxID=103441 RepID=UPI00042A566F|nr:GMC family oxidoreductase [Pseudonocardia spinosispora]
MATSPVRAHDYVVVGSGAAGSVLAERLSADGRYSVLVVEAGGSDRHPRHLVPSAWQVTAGDPRWTRVVTTEPLGAAPGEQWPFGRVLGGSTTINGQQWNRGVPASYDAWERAGLAGWNWAAFCEAYRGIEDHALGAGPERGAGGRLPVSISAPRDPLSDRFIETLEKDGVAYAEDVNETVGERIGYAPLTTRRGRRVSAAAAFLRPARRRRTVTVVTEAEVERVTFEGTRATGVAARLRGRSVWFRAAREVLLCAGAVGSPTLLERSGVGRPDVLAAAGVDLLVESPRVGEGLRQHRGLFVPIHLDGAHGHDPVFDSATGRAVAWARYLATGTGVISHGGSTVMGMFQADPDSPGPDTQLYFAPHSAAPGLPRPGATLAFYPAFPTSQGSVHISGPTIDDAPRIDPRYVESSHDREVLVHAVRRLRRVLAEQPFTDVVAHEGVPPAALPNPDEPEEVVRHALEAGMTGYHAVGTCALGATDDAVLDADLRVRGTQALRVIDASAFPAITAGNNAAPTMALAWNAAHRILRDCVVTPVIHDQR